MFWIVTAFQDSVKPSSQSAAAGCSGRSTCCPSASLPTFTGSSVSRVRRGPRRVLPGASPAEGAAALLECDVPQREECASVDECGADAGRKPAERVEQERGRHSDGEREGRLGQQSAERDREEVPANEQALPTHNEEVGANKRNGRA